MLILKTYRQLPYIKTECTKCQKDMIYDIKNENIMISQNMVRLISKPKLFK